MGSPTGVPVPKKVSAPLCVLQSITRVYHGIQHKLCPLDLSRPFCKQHEGLFPVPLGLDG